MREEGKKGEREGGREGGRERLTKELPLSLLTSPEDKRRKPGTSLQVKKQKNTSLKEQVCK